MSSEQEAIEETSKESNLESLQEATGANDEGLSQTGTEDSSILSTEREPFLAFIPALVNYGSNIVKGEVTMVTKAATGFPHWSKAYMTDSYRYYRANPRTLYSEIISGFTVAIMQVPESIAFSFVAGVPPLSGLHATFWMATVCGIFGGKPGMISGAAGALAVVATDLTADDGVLDYLSKEERLNVLYMTIFVCGLMQIGFALLRLAKLVRLIPETGMIGFMNGLAIIIFMAQLPAFQFCPDEELFVDCTVSERQWLTFKDNTWQLILTLVHVFGCMAIMKFFPKVPKIGKMIPASLVSLVIGTLVEHTLFREAFGVATRTVEETATMSGSLPKFNWPSIPTESDTVNTMFIYAITLAAIGAVESVLTLQACNEITDTVPRIAESNQELFAQGLANLLCGMFSAMGGDAMIGQSTINIMNGARHRVSSTMSGIFMLLFVVALSPLIELLPVGTLTGVLFMVVLSTFQYKTFVILRYGRLSDSGVILIVTLIAVFFNLAIAIAAGVVFSALVHAWDAGAQVDADIELKKMEVNGVVCAVKYVHVKGSIFFGSARHFINLFSVSDDPDTVIVDFKDALIIDHSAVAAIEGVAHRFAKAGKRVLLTNMRSKSHGRMHRTGDHKALKNQIEKAENFHTVDEESHGQHFYAATPDDDVEVELHGVGDLPMFQNPVDPADVELERWAHEHGHANVRELKKAE